MSGSPHPAPAVEYRCVTSGYRDGSPVVTDFSARLAPQGLVHLTGPNGAGKSTVIELASGYLRPWSGTVLIAGEPAEAPRSRARRRVVRSAPALHPGLTVGEHLAFAARCQHADLEEVRQRVAAYGLDPWWDHEARELSTGTTRKLWLLMCTTGSFDVAFLDEPCNGLDDAAIEVLLGELEDWSATRCVVLVAHQLPAGCLPDTTLRLEPVEHLMPGPLVPVGAALTPPVGGSETEDLGSRAGGGSNR
ncbi:putative ABC transporter-like protein [metagenome]|uniref:Putative ABC transporter-like protein n=1 Tax=metagenome TaxID=256318 RepID=A0A2P2BYT6_9ZZZZ